MDECCSRNPVAKLRWLLMALMMEFNFGARQAQAAKSKAN